MLGRIYTKFTPFFYHIHSLFCTKKGVRNSKSRDDRIIVSLTTYKPRLDKVYLTIESLLAQSLKSDKIVIWIYKGDEKYIPKNIYKLQKRGLDIRIVDEDLGSYKKLIYALQEFPNDVIVTVDDDTLYKRDFLKDLYDKYVLYSNCIIANRCSMMEWDSEGNMKPYLEWKGAKDIDSPSDKLFFTGVGGVLYPPKSLYEDVCRKDLFMKLCPKGDDIWFNVMAFLNKTKIIQTHKDFVEFQTVDGTQDEALWKINNGENKNDEQIKKVFDYYELFER